MTSRQQRRRNQSGKNHNSYSRQKNWLLPAGAIVVVIAITLVVISVLASAGTDPEAKPSIVASGGSIIGDPKAPVTLVEFGDFQWSHCRNFALGPGQQIIRDYVNTGSVKIVYRHFPFLGNESWRAAEASECAAEQGRFHEYEETVFVNWNGVNQGTYSDGNLRIFAQMTGLNLNHFDECMSTNKYLVKVRQDVDAAHELGVNSTPTLFLDGNKLENTPDYGYFRVKIEEALNAAGG